MRYVEDTWAPVIEKDVDGPHSLPLALDRDNPNLGRYSACRRVARTLYLGSAPTLNTSRRGLDDRAIKLGCVQPGESVGTFGDALRRLTDEATHLYVDAGRYWLSTQPSVTRLAQDRAAQQDQHEVWSEIVRRLKAEEGRCGDFTAVHTAPASSADVADEMGVRLVVLGPIHTHTARMGDSAARSEAETILTYRGTGARRYRNMLAFLAPDKARLADLEQGVRQYLAWASIERDRDALNLDPFQGNQARLKRDQADEVVRARLHETYAWALVPTQPDPQGDIEWQDMRLQGQDPLLERAGRKLRGEEALITDFAATRLRLELDRVLWAGQDHLGLRTLREYLARYLYLPRLRDADVLLETVRRGMARSARDCETFAYAERWDEASGRYVGLVAGHAAPVVIDDYSVLVRPEAALRQLEADEARRREMDRQQGQEGPAAPYDHAGSDGKPANDEGRAYSSTSSSSSDLRNSSTDAPTPALRRFHGTVMLNDPLRMGRDAGRIAEEIVQHLGAGLNATVRVTLEIDADLPDGAPEQVIYTVTENCRTLKFISHNFEED